MSKRYTYIADLAQHVGKTVTLRGWLHNSRSSGKIRFLILRDGTGFLQSVAGKTDVSPEEFEVMGRIPQESSIEISGEVREDKRAPGGYELTLSAVQTIADADEFPITPKEHGTSFLLDNRHLWVRSRKQYVVMKVRHNTINAIRDFLNDRGFLAVNGCGGI